MVYFEKKLITKKGKTIVPIKIAATIDHLKNIEKKYFVMKINFLFCFIYIFYVGKQH